MRIFKTHGTGQFEFGQFETYGENVVIEPGVLVFHPENIRIGSGVYIGHQTILKGYYKNKLDIGNNVWIGQQCFLHSAGGLVIEDDVGVGPGVKILTATHMDEGSDSIISDAMLAYSGVRLEKGCNVGVGAIIRPGVVIGSNSQVGAGAVVTRNVPPFAVVAGIPARVLRYRRES